jgi:LTXXQ motif family protein
MNMMGMMSGGDAPGMGMIDHVEGRIAFLRSELKITDAQAGAWDAFATALRANAQNLGAARAATMGQMGAGQPQVQTLAQRLDAQERWLTARLDGTRAIKTAFTKLHDVLSQDQKKTADELLAPHMGMGMAMMRAGMGGQTAR